MVELSNAMLTSIKGVQSEKPDLTITINRSDLEMTMMDAVSFDEQIINRAKPNWSVIASRTIS